MGLNYEELANAGNEKIRIGKRPVINYPGDEVVDWYGYKRHNFVLNGRKGFIVEPPNPAPELPWSWCIQWAEAFVPRTPALKLLDRGFHHVFYDVFDTYMSPEGVKLQEQFYAMLQGLHFHPKMALIGMSYGGLFSFRWAAEHPESVSAVYADAPVCDLAFMHNRDLTNALPSLLKNCEDEAARTAAAYGCSVDELHDHPLSPLNNYEPIAKAKIPIFCIRSGMDLTVPPTSNIDIMEKRLLEAGGDIEVFHRDLYGHHPHGLDDPQPLVDFILQHYPGF